MILLIAAEAEADLEEIGDFIAKDSPTRARSFIRELREQCVRLAEMPYASPVVSRYEHHALRRRVYRNYLIFYRVEVDHVVVIHILHGAMDYTSILFPADEPPVSGNS